MNAQAMIESYRAAHSGKSSHIDAQLVRTERAIKDANRCADRNDKDFKIVNLFIARTLLSDLLQAIQAPDIIRRAIIQIYAAIDNSISEIQERR